MSLLKQRIIILFLSFFFVFIKTSFSQTIDRIVAVVNDEVIAQSDVNRVLAAIEAELRTIYPDPLALAEKFAEVKENIINQMVEEKLVICFAKEKGIAVEQDIIEARIEKIKEVFPSEAAFEQALVESDLILKDLRERFNDQEIMKKAVDYFVRSRIKVDPKELKEFYSTHQQDFFRAEKAKVKSIVIKVDEATGEDVALQRANMLLARLKQGEQFEDLAKEYSQGAMASEGGDLGYIERGQLIKEIDGAIFSLGEGEFTDVIKTPSGYHIFKLEEKVPRQPLSFEEAQNLIENMLYQEKFTREFESWIDTLKQNAHIEIKK